MIYKSEFDHGKIIAREVGRFLNKQIVKNIDSQDGKDIKLELDKKSEMMIISSLQKEFNYPILSEEVGVTKQIEKDKPYWIIDPIDGTMNFSRNNPSSCVSIALWIQNNPILGVIYDFNRDELFSGMVGYGSWLNNNKLIHLSKKEISQCILATGFPVYMSDDDFTIRKFISQVQEYKKIRMIGSAALSLAYVACGRFDTYIEYDIKLWDIAAGIAINSAIKNDITIEYLKDYGANIEVAI